MAWLGTQRSSGGEKGTKSSEQRLPGSRSLLCILKVLIEVCGKSAFPESFEQCAECLYLVGQSLHEVKIVLYVSLLREG